MTIPTVSIEWPSNRDAPNVFCPACGAQVLTSDADVQQPSCGHVKFVYIGDIDDFSYVAPEIENQIAASRDTAPEDDLSNGEILERLDGASTCFIYEVTTAGGPVSSNVRIGFDLAGEARDASDA
jgi:hypothetical protein